MSYAEARDNAAPVPVIDVTIAVAPEGKPSDKVAAGMFVGGLICFALVAMILTTTFPLGMAVAIVFLFAGPHNYAEVRYLLTRLPARMGILKEYFLFSAAGIAGLTISMPLITWLANCFQWSPVLVVYAIGGWNTCLILWATRLAVIRSGQRPFRDWVFAWPVGLAVTGVSWLQPLLFPLCLVYLHPLMGFWILDREIRQRRPIWLRHYRLFLLTLPVQIVAVVFLAGVSDPSLIAESVVSQQVRQHVGAVWFADWLDWPLISLHAFLELLHYGVWLVAIPLASGRVFSQRFQCIPLMCPSRGLQRMMQTGLAVSVLAVILLWIGFWADYSTTRTLYFTVAMLHVLAEVPLLLRLL
ncbi:MAG: hypothetical protein KDA85_02220 [Planctomycetaceae bacterium]|nr:hypothetical protein [Planctomycetaceae bacterium]